MKLWYEGKQALSRWSEIVGELLNTEISVNEGDLIVKENRRRIVAEFHVKANRGWIQE